MLLNRTHQTTSASTNRLVLGTRQLAFAANTNMGSKSLRTRHFHPQTVVVVEPPRAGIRRGFEYPSPMGSPKPGTLGSSPKPSWAGTLCMPSSAALAPQERTSIVVPDDRPLRSCDPARASWVRPATLGALTLG